MKRRSGFTLIELLMVVAVIIILLLMFIPAISHVRERANRVVCMSNERQIFSACQMYAVDHGGRMPPGNATAYPGWGIDATYVVHRNIPLGVALLVGGLADAPGLSGASVTRGYLGSPAAASRLLYCPTWSHPFFLPNKKKTCSLGEYGGFSTSGASLPGTFVGISYHYRSTFAVGPYRWNPPSTRLPSPVGSAILSDHWYLWTFDNVWYGQYAHREGYNVIYYDGHAVWKPDTSLFMYTDPVGNGNWDNQEARWQTFFDE
jgi:prepilin-type N-terminal cleavage/methylation domain-containing protein